jgi:hypothetical protein
MIINLKDQDTQRLEDTQAVQMHKITRTLYGMVAVRQAAKLVGACPRGQS